MQVEEMQMEQVRGALTSAAAQVLETMFFAIPEEVSPPQCATDELCLTAEVDFQGACCGAFTISMPQECARAMAANFTGTSSGDVSDSIAAQVLCELAN